MYFVLVGANDSRHQMILGLICDIFTVLFFSSPLASMVRECVVVLHPSPPTPPPPVSGDQDQEHGVHVPPSLSDVSPYLRQLVAVRSPHQRHICAGESTTDYQHITHHRLSLQFPNGLGLLLSLVQLYLFVIYPSSSPSTLPA